MTCQEFKDAALAARTIADRVGPDLRVAMPIGIGKPVLLLNALYRLAEADPQLKLTIFTGLTLTRPRFRTTLEARFAGPLLERLFPSYPEALYVQPRRENRLPANITVHEFFLQAGVSLDSPAVQQSYISLNYSHVARHLQRMETNVFAQVVAPPKDAAVPRVSLGSNTDIALDMQDYIEARRKAGKPVMVAGEINANMPYMPGAAEVETSHFDLMLVPAAPHHELFAPPKEPVSLADYAMALNAATLIRDGGTLQIGIGSFSDALCHALILRHTQNAAFRSLLAKLGTPLPAEAELAPFTEGLYGCTEMLVDGYLALKRAGILKRRVSTPEGQTAILHAGFFVGNKAFYRELHDMPPAELAEIVMSSISYTNTLDGDTARKRRERRDARFINTCMTATLLGAVSSDALDDGRVVSGVGGQHDLIDMAHQLEGARSIVSVRSTRSQNRRVVSNIVWAYANTTVPRSLRDILITEYGIAEIKGRSDRDTIAAVLGITDSAFQRELQAKAMAAGKLERTFRLPAEARDNRADVIGAALEPGRREGLLPFFPLGSEMTEIEQSLIGPLQTLKGATTGQILSMLWAGACANKPTASEQAGLHRLLLGHPAKLADRFWRALVLGAMLRQVAH